jgi:hypothetical protein
MSTLIQLPDLAMGFIRNLSLCRPTANILNESMYLKCGNIILKNKLADTAAS